MNRSAFVKILGNHLLGVACLAVILTAEAHESASNVPMVSGVPPESAGAFVGYYFDEDKKPILSENMRPVSERPIKEASGFAPNIPEVADGQETKDYVPNKCPPTDRSRSLKKWEALFGKKARFAAYYRVKFEAGGDQHPLEKLKVEDLAALTDADREKRVITLLCPTAQADDHCSAAAGHFCSIPCSKGCCCP